MKELEAKNLVDTTFTAAYSENKFRLFIRNLFHDGEERTEKALRGKYIPEAFRGGIVSYKRLFKFFDPEDMEIDVLAVKLKNRRTLENARTMQRNFIARYLNGSRGGLLKDAALVAFYTDDSDEWRFSLVRMDYVLDEEKNKAEKELTPARRFSFLVGGSEKTHTARRQLFPVLKGEMKTTLTELEKAFNIESVTKEFFEKYKGLYLSLKQALEDHLKKDTAVKADFEVKSVLTADFSKRLLGQIVFLYFLQKKGWLGVKKGGAWGSGPKDFLQALHRSEYGNYNNFFNDMLEPLFYEALATERTDNFYMRFNCHIPFLNGGLFEPLQGYDWVNTDILLDNRIFTEIFEVFDLYNFTVREDEPLDREVAVDPEMLGKVFENLIPENERKGSGIFYTPRAIVHYMCQESLINYLDARLNIEQHQVEDKTAEPRLLPNMGEADLLTDYEDVHVEHVPRGDIADFIYHGDRAQEHDTTTTAKNKETSTYSFKIPETIRKNAQAIDEALAHVKICDPAIGSGAFPVGVMNEIVRARQMLNAYLGDEGRTPYDFKRNAIQESIYGVDIEPSAVDIAKLRLWLSLVVDEDDFGNIKPLPNLEYKIVAGNSLIGFPFGTQGREEKLRKLTPLKEEYLSTYSAMRKDELKMQINGIIQSEYNNPSTELSLGYKVDFDFRWSFFEIFDDNAGFDIVIANPPYISHDKIHGKKPIKSQFKSFDAFADIYCYFMELAINIQSRKGMLCFITSNSYLRADYGKRIRNLICNQQKIRSIANLEKSQIFDSAIVNAAILISCSSSTKSNNANIIVKNYDGCSTFNNFIALNGFSYEQKDFSDQPWTLVSREHLKIKKRLDAKGVSLEKYGAKIRLGIATGANEAFLLNEEKKSHLINIDIKNSEIIKPALRGRDINRYSYDNPSSYIVLTRNEIKVQNEYPSIYEYLGNFGDKFKKRGAKGKHWSNLRACAFFDDFKKNKIIWIELTDKSKFSLCKEEIYLVNSAYFMLIPDEIIPEYLLGLLNSKAIHFYLKCIANTSGMGTTRWINNHVKHFPIPRTKDGLEEKISALVGRVINQQNTLKKDTEALQEQIDQLVYQLYDLTSEEIAIIEEATGG